MNREDYLELKWRNLSNTNYQIISPQIQEYNCFAWAAGENERHWGAIPDDYYYFPENVPREETLSAYIQAYQTIGYQPCDSEQLETNYEKIAIYVDKNNIPTHAARQVSNGKWTSKLGWLEDIEHELEGLEGDFYGNVTQILKRFKP